MRRKSEWIAVNSMARTLLNALNVAHFFEMQG